MTSWCRFVLGGFIPEGGLLDLVYEVEEGEKECMEAVLYWQILVIRFMTAVGVLQRRCARECSRFERFDALSLHAGWLVVYLVRV